MSKIIIGIILLGIVYFVFVKLDRSTKNNNWPRQISSQKSISKTEKILTENEQWLENRWENGKKEKQDGTLVSVPQWFFDDATEFQINKLQKEGVNTKPGELTKGQASDLIGLFEPAEEDNLEILRFFKISRKGMNQSKARHFVTQIFKDAENVKRWENRPPTALQKEFFRFFDTPMPSKLTATSAETHIKDIRTNNQEKAEEWDDYESLFDEINDPDNRDSYDIKKISLSLYREAVDRLKEEGHSQEELSDDFDMVIDKIIEIKPDIEKA